MARIAVHEPVQETRELLERLLHRLGHEVVIPAGDDPARIDALVFEAGSDAGRATARRLRDARPGLALVACSAQPVGRALTELGPLEALVQPFSPAQLARALDGALARG